tara:strand:+ start:10994 stop:13129 length:2136 start_codon:yes stop_codon:yes gene_type:complete
LINNYKAQRNVRAELGGAVDLGEPVSLYIAEDEVKVSSKNLSLNPDFDSTDNWTAGTGWAIASGVATCSSGNANLSQSAPISAGKTYQVIVNITSYTSGNLIIDIGGSLAHTGTATGDFGSVGTHKVILNPINTNDLRLYGGAFRGSVDNIKIYEVTDHTYKLMAVNDNIPATPVNTEAEGSEMITDTKNRDFSSSSDWDVLNIAGGSLTEPSNKLQIVTSTDEENEGAQLAVAKLTTPVAGRTYRISAELQQTSGATTPQIGFQFAGTGSSYFNISASAVTYTQDIVATNTTGNLMIFNTSSASSTTFKVDDISVKELYGYDYYNAPAYKFGIVSSIYDQSTGAMKTTGAAGDQVDVTVQGECTLHKSGTYTLNADRIISRITSASALDSATPSSSGGDLSLPNAVAVTSEATSSSNTQPIILFQGVEFSEHFVHKNSLQVHAKCDEAITKFRPVSLFLDSNGDLLCRHDDIPETTPDQDTDHTGVDPGKWGISELGGASGDIIPITIAGKTTLNTGSTTVEGSLIGRIAENGTIGLISGANNNYVPNGIATMMESGTGDVPITIFGGTPIGTITDWKRTIKVTAKANGAITQYCPVSLYLDQWGDYRCISDNIPNGQTLTGNDEWVDFRKWGVAQTTVADGEFVEIIVQGRTNVVDTITNLERKDFVNKIAADGSCHGDSSTARALSSLGIVEKEAKTSDGTPGVIIIF